MQSAVLKYETEADFNYREWVFFLTQGVKHEKKTEPETCFT